MNLLQAGERLLCERSLKYFIKTFWNVVEPCEFVDGWHIDAIVEHLEAVTFYDIRNLLINMPPRCAKSLIISVFWFCWVWTIRPECRFIYASYAQTLSVRDSLKCRRLLLSLKYQAMFGDKFRITGDQNTKIRFENDKSGHRISTSVGGVGTGEGGDIICADDAQSAAEAFSKKIVQATMDWWDNAMSTRGNDAKTVCRVIVMQRLAANDLSAHVLEQGGYVHLFLPMEFETERRCITSLGWEDPRTKEGELLWPERFDKKAIAEFKQRMNPYMYAGQMQQRPAPKGGLKFRREWFSVVKAAPANAMRIRYWDRAGTEVEAGDEGDPDYTVGLLMAKDANNICYIEDIVRFRGSDLMVLQSIKNVASQDGPLVQIGLEQDPGQAGKADVKALIRNLMGYNVGAFLATKSKELRATPLSAWAEAGNVKLIDGPWIKTFFDELESFPMGEHDDQVDAASGAFNALSEQTSTFEGMTID